MIRRLLLAGVLLVGLPGAARADGGGPLRSYCDSPGMTYCMSIWSYDYSITFVPSGYVQRVEIGVELFGDGYLTGAEYQPGFLSHAYGTGSDLSGYAEADGPGFYTLVDATGDQGVPDFQGHSPGVDDIKLIHFSIGEVFAQCYVGVDCYPVPEPGSMLLVATGIVGLFGMARLTKRER